MPILQAIGFGIFLLVLKLMLPDVLTEGRATAVAFLHGARISAEAASTLSATALQPRPAGTHTNTLNPSLLPQAPSIPEY